LTEFHKRSGKTRRHSKKSIEKHFSERRSPEDNKRLKQKRKERDAERAKQGSRRKEWFDDDGEIQEFEKIRSRADDKPAPKPSVPVTDPGLPDADIGVPLTHADSWAGVPGEAPGGPPGDAPGDLLGEAPGELPGDASREDDGAAAPVSIPRARVVAVAQGRVQVLHHDELMDALLPRHLAEVQQTALAVGDEVLLDGSSDVLRVRQVLPRRTELARPDPSNAHRRRVLAANVDVAVLVLSARRPAFKPGLVDRFLVALDGSGIEPAIVVNKVDLCADNAEREALAEALSPFTALGLFVLQTSAENTEGLDSLTLRLAGRTSVFVGHSGVGKSSLLNGLDPESGRRVGAGRDGDGKGRHTTTSSSLTMLSGGTVVIDTPGVRAFGLWHLDPPALRAAFPELVEHGAGCRFRDCSHLVEPDCAVQQAVEDGALDARRFAAYERILASLEQA
jgi:ribosome biogenesis GTPase